MQVSDRIANCPLLFHLTNFKQLISCGDHRVSGSFSTVQASNFGSTRQRGSALRHMFMQGDGQPKLGKMLPENLPRSSTNNTSSGSSSSSSGGLFGFL